MVFKRSANSEASLQKRETHSFPAPQLRCMPWLSLNPEVVYRKSEILRASLKKHVHDQAKLSVQQPSGDGLKSAGNHFPSAAGSRQSASHKVSKASINMVVETGKKKSYFLISPQDSLAAPLLGGQQTEHAREDRLVLADTAGSSEQSPESPKPSKHSLLAAAGATPLPGQAQGTEASSPAHSQFADSADDSVEPDEQDCLQACLFPDNNLTKHTQVQSI